jgi:phospholipid transport system substrate-binding protein
MPLPPNDRGGRYRARRLGSLLTIGINAFLVGAFLLLAAPAHAGSVEQFVLDFNQRLSSELGPTDLSEADRRTRFAALLDEYLDLNAASALMLGPRWGKASAEERAQFCAAFRDYLIHNFASRIHGAGARRLQITGVVLDGPNATVSSEFSTDHIGALSVDWRLAMGGDATWRLSNVTVAGLSMAAVMRAQFDAVPDQNGAGLPPLVSLLREQQRGQ